MPVVPTGEILSAAYRERYGVAAINVVNDLTLEAVLAAATEQRAPLIVQTSVKTVRSIGYDVLYEYRGRQFSARLPHDPGRMLPVRIDVQPEIAPPPPPGPRPPAYR